MLAERPRSAGFKLQEINRTEVKLWINCCDDFLSENSLDIVPLAACFSPSETRPPIDFLMHGKETLAEQNRASAFDNVIEISLLNNVVQCVVGLANHLPQIRVGSAMLLVQLAKLFDSKLNQKDSSSSNSNSHFSRLFMAFQTDSTGDFSGLMCAAFYFSHVQTLFGLIGSSLSVMADAFSECLESFYICPNWKIRGVALSALSNLVFENAKIFSQEEHSATAWNLYFTLSTISKETQLFQDRIVLIQVGCLGLRDLD